MCIDIIGPALSLILVAEELQQTCCALHLDVYAPSSPDRRRHHKQHATIGTQAAATTGGSSTASLTGRQPGAQRRSPPLMGCTPQELAPTSKQPLALLPVRICLDCLPACCCVVAVTSGEPPQHNRPCEGRCSAGLMVVDFPMQLVSPQPAVNWQHACKHPAAAVSVLKALLHHLVCLLLHGWIGPW